jgi:SAM-dependent methyltransferase
MVMEIDAARFERLEQQVTQIKNLLLNLNTLVTERLLDDSSVLELTKGAWRNAKPTAALTWNAEMTGDAFVDRMTKLRGPLGRVLEIGPGYGRVLRTLLERAVAFDSYTGVDISEQNVAHLKQTFTDQRLKFVHSDIFEFVDEQPYNTVYSSAVFMHIYPDIGGILRRCRELLRAGGAICFDVPLGGQRMIHSAQQLYVHEYTRPLLQQHAKNAGYSSCEIVDEPGFAPGKTGLFVCMQV